MLLDGQKKARTYTGGARIDATVTLSRLKRDEKSRVRASRWMLPGAGAASTVEASARVDPRSERSIVVEKSV